MQNLNTFCLPENREMISINICHDSDRPTIYRIRHQIYAEELGQHEINDHKELKDHLDHDNEYLIVKESDQIKGFVSITPPKNQTYSIDKYFSRVDVPCSFDNNLYEVRLLTVPQGSRGRLFASLLMYGAFRWIQNRGGKQIVAIGRKEVKKLYQKVGFKFTDLITQSGQVSYQLMIFNLDEAESHLKKHFPLLQKIKQISKWNLAFPFEAKSQPCFHGGAFFQAIGEQFDAVESRHEIVNADVLDAWFPPTPSIEELC
jgi:N-acyl-L-homoserine lactone synthetase